jgi:hypothetical protein
MMKRAVLALLLVTPFLAACGGAARSGPQGADRSRWSGDPRLYGFLLTYPMTEEQHDSVAAYATEHMSATPALLAEAAEDVNAPASVRVNAMMVLAQRRQGSSLTVFRDLLDDEDVRIRATAVAAMREFVQTHPYEAVRIARVALTDDEPDVQAQALQIVGDNDLDLLRGYVPRAANDDLRAVARDLVRVAEERGAPLQRDSATGALSRTTFNGHTVTFTASRHWPQWDAAYGTVRIAQDGAAAVVIDGVEAVGGVLPVFFSADGRFVVYERDRTIVVRTLDGGAERVLGPGIAPRVRPFTSEFVFLRPAPDVSEERGQARVTYDVVNAHFDAVGGSERVIGSATATVSFGTRGAYSPARWMRVEDKAGNFYLTADNFDIVPLPDPFVAGS